MDINPPGSSVHGILRRGDCRGWPFPSPGDPPNPGIEPASLVSPAGGFLAPEPWWEGLSVCTPSLPETPLIITFHLRLLQLLNINTSPNLTTAGLNGLLVVAAKRTLTARRRLDQCVYSGRRGGRVPGRGGTGRKTSAVAEMDSHPAAPAPPTSTADHSRRRGG